MFTGDYSTGNAVLIPAREFVKGMRGQVVIPDAELAKEYSTKPSWGYSDNNWVDYDSREVIREDSETEYWKIHS